MNDNERKIIEIAIDECKKFQKEEEDAANDEKCNQFEKEKHSLIAIAYKDTAEIIEMILRNIDSLNLK